ncbi:ThuA domain-containing protein [Parasediminibacterium sp. JCM 36343]|uniref:ThuA domain-containing protein n=1 Tax=Parasediminibacterium sp. JCM 36343 TaxID=3374279 RepID=UPI00397BFABB
MKYGFAFLLFNLILFSAWASHKRKPIKVLIVDGYSNHNWRQTTTVVKTILEESKLFEVSVSTAPDNAGDSVQWQHWNPSFNAYDVVIQNTNNGQNKQLRWPRRVEEALQDYVRNGGGLYVLHAANNAYTGWLAYDTMMGLGWRTKENGYAVRIDSNGSIIKLPPSAGGNTTHGKRFTATIHVLQKSHPICKGFPDSWQTPSMELYNDVRGPFINTTILSYATDSVNKQNYPVEWVVSYGKGRVYSSSMGHLWKDEVYPIAYRCIGFQTTLIRAAEWLATGKATYPLPRNFPTSINVSVRDESDFPKNK